MPFTIAGDPTYADPSQRPGAGFGMVSPDYFATFGIRVEKGRTFDANDTTASPRVAMVSESFVKQYFKNVDPLKQRVVVEELIPGVTKLGPPVEWQIVGVYHDVHAADRRNILNRLGPISTRVRLLDDLHAVELRQRNAVRAPG